MADKPREYSLPGEENWEGLPPLPPIAKGDPPEIDYDELAKAFAPPKVKRDAADIEMDAVIGDVVRESLLTPEQRNREERAARLERAGFVEVNGNLMRKDQAQKLDVEDDDIIGRVVRSFNLDVDALTADDDDDDDYYDERY